jgi:hypothetical protein
VGKTVREELFRVLTSTPTGAYDLIAMARPNLVNVALAAAYDEFTRELIAMETEGLVVGHTGHGECDWRLVRRP